MKALIFNSGVGKRMGDFTRSNHKSMARLSNGETIFGRQLRLLAAAGITEVVVTTGPFADQLRAETQAKHLQDVRFTFVPNDRYDTANYIISMHLARPHLATGDDLLMLHGDLVFNTAALRDLLNDDRPNLGMVNASLPQPEKDFKARIVDGRIAEIATTLSDSNCYAFQPLYKLSGSAADAWFDRVADFVARDELGVYAENALNDIHEQVQIEAFSYESHSVNEVDTLDDLERVSAEIRLFDFAEQQVLTETDSYLQMPTLLGTMCASRPLVVGGNSVDASFIKPFLDSSELQVARFTGYSSNPKLEEVLAGLAKYRDQQCDSIISVGGGSAIDVAKCIQLLVAADSEQFPSFGAPLKYKVPHLAVPATAGTGSESTHFAVVYIDGEKHSIAHDGVMPDWVVLEPRLLETLPEYHRKATLLDALSQCVESSWAKSGTEQSRAYALEGISLILANLFAYFHGAGFDPEAARKIMLAANLSGRAINLTKTTAPHAMSYQMTSMYGTAHGHAAALCLAGVWRYFVHLAAQGTQEGMAIAPALERLRVAFAAESAEGAVDKLEIILEFLRMPPPALRSDEDLDELVASVNAERLGNSPVPLGPEQLRRIYEFVFERRPAPYESDEEFRETFLPGETAAARYANMRLLQAHMVGALKAFDEFCAKHELQYYLSEGTILGAIRHGGMIPWDDDVDVMMPRDDFNRFIDLAKDGGIGERFNLDCFETNPQHWVLGAKVQLTEPTEFYLPGVQGRASFDGPYIDVFPVDPVARTSGRRFGLQKFLLRGLRRMLFMSSGHQFEIGLKPHVRLPMYLVTRVVAPPTIHRWVVWTQTKLNASADATHWANLCTYYPIDKEVFPREWFGAGKRVPFEGLELLVPTNAEGMLESIYSAKYMQIPNMESKLARKHGYQVRADA